MACAADLSPPGPPSGSSPSTLYGIDLGIPLGDRRVLVADTSPFNRRTLARFLQWAGITKVGFAGSGPEVLAQVAAMEPDLLLIDSALPQMDGIAVCRALRSDPRWRDLPIVLQSANQSDHLRAVCFQAGANDLLTKPINPGECVARVRYHLERRSMVQELRSFRERLERDLAQARAMQLSLVPDAGFLARLAGRSGLAIEPVFQSSDEIGGDVWTAVEIDPDHVGVLVADLSGHGITAAINAFRLHTLLSRASPVVLRDPAGLLSFLNLRLAKILSVGQFATCFYGVFNRREDRLRYATAGAPSPILLPAGGEPRRLDGSGFLLGAFAGATFETQDIPFRHGDRLFLYSDGLSEARDAEGRMLGEEGLTALVAAVGAESEAEPAAGRGLERTGSPLRRLMARFTGRFGDRPADDLTALWIERD
ncbi:PP2C family protein-serine/threonine phosphatase [Azospirillum thermophilum]|uniref:Regulator n=1 Tax=Azospirillum thermophilum TaxID=2202148 RepID=A0A2S2CQ44_9PROT|nr:response regulator [Azospirillum thermophilum]AWK86437.1 regulator [Azospirillum thermophilum]